MRPAPVPRPGVGDGRVQLWLDAVIVAVTAGRPRVLTVVRGSDGRRPGSRDAATLDALPFGPLDVGGDRTLEGGLRRHVRQQTGLELGYVEQLYTFGDALRDPREAGGGARSVSAAYLALVREERPVAGDARWRDIYGFFPWEDHRAGRPAEIDAVITPVVEAWIARAVDDAGRAVRRERADIALGRGQARWDDERVLARYELLYELGLAPERAVDRDARGERGAGGAAEAAPVDFPGRAMALDHRRILASALGRLRAKIKYRPVVFELLPPEFTLRRLQRSVEALAGVGLHVGNFRRLVERGGLVEGTGRFETATGGRPAERFRFRREVLRERRAPGVGLPGAG